LNEGPDEEGREGGEESLPRPLSDLKERAEVREGGREGGREGRRN